MRLTSRSWYCLGLWVNLATWCTAYATSARIRCQIHQHSNNWCIFPVFFKIQSIWVSPNWCPCGWSLFHLHHSFLSLKELSQSNQVESKRTYLVLYFLSYFPECFKPFLHFGADMQTSLSEHMPRFAISTLSTSPLEPTKNLSSTFTKQIIPSFINKQGSKLDYSNPISSRPNLSFSKNALGACLILYMLFKSFRTRSLGEKYFGSSTNTVDLCSAWEMHFHGPPVE